MQVTTAVSGLAPKLAFSEILSFAFETFCSNKVRFLLTGLGMVIGTASLFLVVTIGLTGKQYVLNLIQGIGANLIYAEYEGGSQRITNTAPDPLTIDDMTAARGQVPGIVAASPVSRYFQDTPSVKLLYFSVGDPSMVEPVTEQIQRVIQSRHRAESVYNVTNLTQLVAVAEKAADALTFMLLGVAAVVLLVSGIGIMNIMLATVSARIREIGIRKALGATNREIRFQFLSEAILISVGGGLIGVVIGLAVPYSVRFLTEYRIPISGLSAIVAIVVSSLVGILFGTVPAARAAKLDPVESLRYE